jgi:hypothetical protein
MAQLSLKITAETDDPVWQWGRDLVSAIERRAKAEGVEIVFTFQTQNEERLMLGDATSSVYWVAPGFWHRCRCGRHFRFRCRPECRGPTMPGGASVEEAVYLPDTTSDHPRQRIKEKARELSWQRMREILEQRELGVSYGEIAQKMGVSRQRARQLHERGLELRSKGFL